MGRAKLNMELITKEKSRNITFKKRKEGLVRKMHEFTTLCDVSACMIIYGPKQEKGCTEPEIWPPRNPEEVHRIIGIYKSKSKDSGNKTFGLSDFFHDRKRKIEEELAKLRKKNMEAKYPTRPEFMNFMTEGQLREFASVLSNKAEYVRSRIEILRRNQERIVATATDMNLMADFAQATRFYTPTAGVGMRGVELEMRYNQELHHHAVNQNSMMMLLMNENDHSCVQFGGGGVGGSSSGNIQTSFKRQVFYEGVVDPATVICHSPRPLSRYYAAPVLPPPAVPPYMQVMPGMMPPQLQLPWDSSGVGGQEDVAMKNHKARVYEYKGF